MTATTQLNGTGKKIYNKMNCIKHQVPQHSIYKIFFSSSTTYLSQNSHNISAYELFQRCIIPQSVTGKFCQQQRILSWRRCSTETNMIQTRECTYVIYVVYRLLHRQLINVDCKHATVAAQCTVNRNGEKFRQNECKLNEVNRFEE